MCELYTRAIVYVLLPFVVCVYACLIKKRNWNRTNAKTIEYKCNLGGGPGSAPRCDMRGAACNH